MKKFAVIVAAVVIVLLVLLFSGVLDTLLSLVDGGTKTSEPISGIYYLYDDHYEIDEHGAKLNTADSHYIRLDFVKNDMVTYNDFGDKLSILTANDSYLVTKEGIATSGNTGRAFDLRYKKHEGQLYVCLEDLKASELNKDLGIEFFDGGDYCYITNGHYSYNRAVLSADENVFESRENLDEYFQATSKREKGKIPVRGIATTDIEGYCYSMKLDDRNYSFFISENSRLSGYVDGKNLKSRKETEKIGLPTKNKAKDIVMVWEAVYVNIIDTDEIGKMAGVNTVSPTWYTLRPSGEVESIVDPAYISWAAGRGYNLWPLISNNSDIDLTHEFLSSYDDQMKFIETLVDEAVKYGYTGYNLDFEYIYKTDRDAYSHFVHLFSHEMEKWGLICSVDVNVMDGADNWSQCYDHAVLGAVSDLLVVMTYDQHHAGSPSAGPNAAYNWVEYNIKKIVEVVDPAKVVMGVPFYTRVWETTGSDTKSEVLDMYHTDEYLASLPFEIEWDDLAKQRKAKYRGDGSVIEVWIEDADSLRIKAGLVEELGLGGIAAWRRGFETDDAWPAIAGDAAIFDQIDEEE